jgi:hypothetical protein
VRPINSEFSVYGHMTIETRVRSECRIQHRGLKKLGSFDQDFLFVTDQLEVQHYQRQVRKFDSLGQLASQNLKPSLQDCLRESWLKVI